MTPRPAVAALTILFAVCSWAVPAVAQVAFTPCDVSVGGGPVALATDDFNSDGNPDLAIVDQQRNQVIVLLTDPQALRMLNCNNAGTRADVAVGTSPVAIAAGDLDRNLTVDLAVATQAGISILRGNASGVFMADPPIPAGADPRAVAIADVNGDARADIIVGNGSGNSVTILFGAAQNEFSLMQAVVLPTGAPVTFLVAADLNLDGAPDIVAGSTLSGQVRVFLHDAGSETMFRALPALTVGTAPTAMAVVDLTRDAVPDLAVVGGGIDGALSIFRSNLATSENPAFSLSDQEGQIGVRPSSVAAGNIDTDFDPDLVVTNQDDDTIPFFFGNGNGTVDREPVTCATSDGMCATAPAPRVVVLADVDGDGRLDVITANQGDGAVAGSISFFLSSRPATPTATAIPTPPTPTPIATHTPSPTITPIPADTPTPTLSPIPTPFLSDCFIPRPAPGCDMGECSACVCTDEGADAFCCDEQWDLTCVQIAEGRCAPSCPRADTPVATLTPTITETPTITLSPSSTPTETPTPTGSRSRTPSPTATATGPTPTESQTPTNTPTETPTQTRRPTSTPRCVGEGMSQICTSGDTCAIAPNQQGSRRGLLVLLPGILGLVLRRLRPRS